MVDKPRVYIETTIISYLTARPSHDPALVRNQEVTREWWKRRDNFELLTSRLVATECSRGDPAAAALRRMTIEQIRVVDETSESERLAHLIAHGVSLPPRVAADAARIAIAATNGLNYLLTWNCTHIANPLLQSLIASICQERGHQLPLIYTPFQLLNHPG